MHGDFCVKIILKLFISFILVKYTLTLFLLYVYVCVNVYIFMYVCAHLCEFPCKIEKETGVPEAEGKGSLSLST